METKEGVITDTAATELREDVGQAIVKYHNPANVTINVGDGVVYIKIVTGNGQTINIIKEKKV
mgnify:FL=1